MRRAYKYRLFTNANQERELEAMLETHRRLYNACLAERKQGYETAKLRVKYTEQSARFTVDRTVNPYYARINFSSAQATMRRLDKAFTAFFRRLKTKGEKPGYPRFRSRDSYDSFEFPMHGDGARLTGNRLRIRYIGTIRVKLHRVPQGTIKTLTVKREGDHWYVIASCDLGAVSIPQSRNPPVGIDVGIEAFLTTSDGVREHNPNYLKKALPELRRKSRSVSRKKKGGSNRRKAVKRLRKVHAHVRNLRKEHHHQVALRLVRRHGLIAAESLNVRGMVRNRRFSRSISDVAWGNFLLTLRCKAESAGVVFVEVDPCGTSQACSDCGRIVQKTIHQRRHICDCGCNLHRDHNAARNVLAAGLARTGPAGAKVGNSQPSPRSHPL